MKILITGGLGNLGLWLTLYLLEQRHDVAVIGRNERFVITHEHYRFLKGDITDVYSLNSIVDCYYDVCIHAASFNEYQSPSYNKDALIINSFGTELLCQSLARFGIGKLIYLSTFHVYGATEGVVTEQTHIAPTNDYALTHYFAEKYIEKNARLLGFEYLIFRLTNSYGCPKDINTDKWYLVLNDLCLQAFNKNVVTLNGNGKALRDFIWMGDVTCIVEKFLYLKTTGILNLASSKTFAIIDVATCVQSAYFDYFGKELVVNVNEHDDYKPTYLTVSNQCLVDILPYTFDNHFKTEAINIFKMLSEKR
ncbi:NAD-dependent epimerase/dehydratase family protein [Shewanella baltica]|uniref:NAD-dependent epimerase/dehydratase family protein n=1 Tax=Shewanella baltica TaxID=62322 RepID=UPI003D79ADD8